MTKIFAQMKIRFYGDKNEIEKLVELLGKIVSKEVDDDFKATCLYKEGVF